MKKLSSIILASLLLVSSAAAAAILNTSKEPKEVKADNNPPRYTGLFERIEDASEVTPGTQVIIANSRGWVFDGIGGNPAYAQATGSGVTTFPAWDTSKSEYEQDNLKFIYLNNKDAVLLTVEQGASSYLQDHPHCVSFKSTFYVDGGWRVYEGHYFGENQDQDPKEYDTIAWFMDGFGMTKKKDGHSTWDLTYDSVNKKMLMLKLNIPNDPTGYLHYSYGTARHHFNFGSAEDSDINLYRPVDPSKLTRSISSNPVEDPVKTTYHKGDLIEYDGLMVEFGIDRGNNHIDYYNLKYDWRTSVLFSSPIVVYENTLAYVRIFDNTEQPLQYNFQITIVNNASNNVYKLKSALPADYRGTYLLATGRDGGSSYYGRIFNASMTHETTDNFNNDRADDIFNKQKITADLEELDNSIIKIVRTEINNAQYYHAVNSEGKYLCMGVEHHSGSGEYWVSSTTNATVSNAVTITSNTFRIGNYYLGYTNTSKRLICFTPDYNPMEYFKLDEATSSIASEVSGFVSYFEQQTEVCSTDSIEHKDKISDELWNNIKNEFLKLSVDAQGIFASTTYTHDAEEELTKENVVDRYDYIVDKYGKEDFMLRKLANTYSSNYSNNALSIFDLEDSSSILVITVAIACVTATLALLIFKKKKAR